jgi:hypothetical protein
VRDRSGISQRLDVLPVRAESQAHVCECISSSPWLRCGGVRDDAMPVSGVGALRLGRLGAAEAKPSVWLNWDQMRRALVAERDRFFSF